MFFHYKARMQTKIEVELKISFQHLKLICTRRVNHLSEFKRNFFSNLQQVST